MLPLIEVQDLDQDSEFARLSPQLPKLKFGFWLAGFIFFMEFVWAFQRVLAWGPLGTDAASVGGYAAALFFVGSIVSTAYLLHCVATYHRVLGDVEGWTHPISPRRAVRFHFIPFFNLYWNYKWPWEIARFVNWRTQTHRMSGILAGTVTLAGFFVAGFLI